MSSDLRKVGALWAKEGKNGEFFSGTLDAEAVKSALAGGETRLLLFPVRQRRERGPAYELFCVPDDRGGQRVDRMTTPAQARPSRVDNADDPFEF